MSKKEIRRNKENIKKYKTNIDILDYPSWNRFKYEAKQKGFKTVSENIFFLIKVDEQENFFQKILLKEFEKYYEFLSYSYKDISIKFGLNLEIILDFMEKNNLEIISPNKYLKNYRNNVNYIHDLMFKNDILPREFKIGKNLFKIFNKTNYITSRNFLEIIFQDEKELKNREIFQFIFFIFEQLKLEDFEICRNCNSKNECAGKDVISIFYKNGIDIEEEDLELDYYYNKLKETNSVNFYGIISDLAIYLLIKKELFEIKKMVKNNTFYQIKHEDILKQKIEAYISNNINKKVKEIEEKLNNYELTVPKSLANLMELPV